MDKEKFKTEINDLRKTNKAKWYFWVGYVDNKKVEIKGFKTWLQIFRVDDINIPCPMELNVTKFKEILDRV